MRIGIDARPLTSKKAGIGYYLEGLLKEIIKNDKENEYYLFSDREICFDIEAENLHKIQAEGSIKKTLWYFMLLPKVLKKYKINLFWGTQHVLPLIKDKSLKKVLTIHDLVCYEYPETMSKYNKIINKLLLPYSVKSADEIIAVSNSTKEGILKNFESSVGDKVSVIYEDVEIKNEINFDIDRKKDKYILFIGTIEPRKNITTLLDAYELIRDKIDIKLIIAGKLGWDSDKFKNSLKNNKYYEDIQYLDYISNEEKLNLLRKCTLFVFPSVYEGFGLPVLEAMRLGAIPIVSNVSSLDELIEPNFMKFDPRSKEEIFKTAINLLEDDKLYLEATKYIENRQKDFNWNLFSKEYINLFNRM